nr:hypothetical protein Itr_chr02CG08160 [Ipomoea trifida]
MLLGLCPSAEVSAWVLSRLCRRNHTSPACWDLVLFRRKGLFSHCLVVFWGWEGILALPVQMEPMAGSFSGKLLISAVLTAAAAAEVEELGVLMVAGFGRLLIEAAPYPAAEAVMRILPF